MKSFKKIFVSLLILLSLILIPNFSNAETTHEVNNQDSLVSAIEEAENGDIIKLTENIQLTSPVGITDGKKITIDGNGKSISKASEGWVSDGPNGSLLTAGGTGTKLTLNNITLKDAEKYGVQSYNGAHVILNNVTVTNNGYGGVLVNAGTVEIIKLNLGKNGKSDNNGIEIGKGDATGDKVPELIMNGTISSEEDKNVIYIATNNEKLTDFTVKNTENTTDKILIEGNKVVITDKDNKILFESNENSNLKIAGEEYVEEKAPEQTKPSTDPEVGSPTTTPENQEPSNTQNTENPTPDTTTPVQTQTTTPKDVTPKTGLSYTLAISLSIITVSIISIALLKNKKE